MHIPLSRQIPCICLCQLAAQLRVHSSSHYPFFFRVCHYTLASFSIFKTCCNYNLLYPKNDCNELFYSFYLRYVTEHDQVHRHRSTVNTERVLYHKAKQPTDVFIPSGKILTRYNRVPVNASNANYYSADRLPMPTQRSHTGITSDPDCVCFTSATVNAYPSLHLLCIMLPLRCTELFTYQKYSNHSINKKHFRCFKNKFIINKKIHQIIT